MKKQLTATVMAATLLLGACGGTAGGPVGGGGGGSSKSLTIKVFDGGYGDEYLSAVARAFTAVNKGTKVTVKTTVDPQSEATKVESDIYVCDLFISTLDLNSYGREGHFLPIEDVYKTTPTGETKTVEEKLGLDLAVQYDSWDGHRYQMPFNDGMTGITYNKTTLDTIFGAGNWTLPVTSDELEEFCQAIISASTSGKEYYPFVYSIDTNAEYQWWTTYTFMAQLMGVEEYQKFHVGQLKGDDGEYYFDINGEEIADNEKRFLAIEETQRFNGHENKMATKWCDSMDFAEAQAYFLGYGYGNKDKGKAVFMNNGDWVYNEMLYLISDDNPQDIRMMRVPVSSKIINYTETVSNDRELRALIHALDNGATALTGDGYDVSQEDFDRIKEARSIIFSTQIQQIGGIPKNSKNVELAKKFMTFFASDTAAAIYAQQMHGDVTPYVRTVSDGVTPNAFIQSKLDLYKENTTLLMSMQAINSKFKFGAAFTGLYYYSQLLHNGTALEEAKSATYRQSFLTRYMTAKQEAGIQG